MRIPGVGRGREIGARRRYPRFCRAFPIPLHLPSFLPPFLPSFLPSCLRFHRVFLSPSIPFAPFPSRGNSRFILFLRIPSADRCCRIVGKSLGFKHVLHITRLCACACRAHGSMPQRKYDAKRDIRVTLGKRVSVNRSRALNLNIAIESDLTLCQLSSLSFFI